MGLVKPSTDVVFADEKLKKAWTQAQEIEPGIAKQLMKAKEDLMKNAFCGKQFSKRLIPKEYIDKYKITNLWKYKLSDSWRLLYSISTPTTVEIISVVLDWMDHKQYERLFKF